MIFLYFLLNRKIGIGIGSDNDSRFEKTAAQIS